MRWPFVLRAHYDAVKAEADRQRTRAEEAEDQRDTAIRNRNQVLAQNADLHAANKRLDDRKRELSRRLDSAHDANLGELGTITDLEAQARRLQDELAAARADTDTKVAAAEERGRQAARAMTTQQREARPADGAPASRRDQSAELRRMKDLCRDLTDRLALMQVSHIADTRELHDLRQQGGTS